MIGPTLAIQSHVVRAGIEANAHFDEAAQEFCSHIICFVMWHAIGKAD